MIDTHCHLYAEEFNSDRPEVIQRAKTSGVDKIFLPAIDGSTHEAMMGMARNYPGYCFPMMGLHPCYVDGNYEAELELVSSWLSREKFYAIGEVGLDYYHSTEFKDQQIDAFSRQIKMAIQYELPIIIHTRNAIDDCIKMIQEEGKGLVNGIFHCFGGDERQAKKVIDLGFMLGIGGVVTYKNAGLAKLLESIPLEYLVLETDAPYLTPFPHRGKRNEPSYLSQVASKLAAINSVDVEKVDEVTTANAKKIFGF